MKFTLGLIIGALLGIAAFAYWLLGYGLPFMTRGIL